MKTQTAAIYDRWLFTLGGGEQVAFAYAAALHELGYNTSLLTHKKVDRQAAERKMGVDLSDITITYLPAKTSQELSEYTENYDVFINTSYLDYFSNRADVGLLSVFFPGQIYLTPYEYIKRALLLPSLKTFFIYPSIFEGFRYDEYRAGTLYKWLGQKSSIIFNNDIKKLKIGLYCKTTAFSVIDSIKFSLNNDTITPEEVQLDHQKNIVYYTFSFKNHSTKNKQFSITLPDLEYTENIALVSLTILSLRYFFYNLFKRFFPKWEMRLHGGPGVTKRADLESYDEIITISKFCRKWIKKYWGLPSSILYPPVNTNSFAPATNKKNHIIHIGRFFVTGHGKKQLEMVKIFKKLVDTDEVEGWELHFIGSVHEGTKHQQYYEQVCAEAEGYPVHFHVNIPFNELTQRLSEAKIYWHATGLDEDEEKNPIVFEHFGVTTVEAMASGCVPIVINAGGQKEIVTDDSGFTWNNRKEWLQYTKKLIEDQVLWQKYSQQAVKRSKFFSRKNFKKRFNKLLQQHNS